MMTVVKADGYGHGMVEVARAAREGGADWLGVAVMEEALALRAAGDTGPILTLARRPGQGLYRLRRGGCRRHRLHRRRARRDRHHRPRDRGPTHEVQLQIDTGLSRGGSTEQLWAGLVQAAAAAGGVRRGPGHRRLVALRLFRRAGPPGNKEQEDAFREACFVLESTDIEPEVRHLANSAAALRLPPPGSTWCAAGSRPTASRRPPTWSSAELGLVPAMTVQGRLALVKRVPAGAGVSYGLTYRTPAETTVGVVPAQGYGDGVPRHASSPGRGAGRRPAPVLGRVCMDQLVVDLGDDDVATGDEVVLFGTGATGNPLPRTGPRRATPSATRSSRAWARSSWAGCPRCMWTPTRRKVRTGEEGTPARAGGSEVGTATPRWRPGSWSSAGS